MNDGICDPACCDGSDEYDGQITCPNTCKERGAQARQAAEENIKTALRGWKIRTSYIDHAKRKRAELEAELERIKNQIAAAEQKEQELKVVLDRAEIRESKVSKVGEKIVDRAREKIEEYKSALTALRDEIAWHAGRIEALEGILEALKNDHNQNYHDMAVKTAVSGWNEVKGQEIPEFGITEEQLDLLEKETPDLGDDDVDFTDEFDETVGSRMAPLEFLLIYSLSVSRLRAFTGQGFCKGENRIYPLNSRGSGISTETNVRGWSNYIKSSTKSPRRPLESCRRDKSSS